MPDLDPDVMLQLPRVTVLKASAGSGKTWALTERFAQFLLSSRVPHNDLRNILAITFSNNASREMRSTILEWLKRLAFRDPERLRDMASLTDGGEAHVAGRAAALVDTVLSRFSDFQVQTIDSFMAAIFRASALDFGFSPELEIVMDASSLVEYAFTLFVRDAEEGSDGAKILDETVAAILGLRASDDSFPWEPAGPLLAELQDIEARLSAHEVHAPSDAGARALERAARTVRDALEEVARLVLASGLEPSGNSTFPEVLASVRSERYSDLIGRGMKAAPVKKPPAKDTSGLAAREAIIEAWEAAAEAVRGYTAAWGRAFFEPYLRLHGSLSETVARVKRSQGKVAIGDIGGELARYIESSIVPDVYFRIGERVWHYLIDEFQDTSPVQWRALSPLVENSLSVGGSLFVVGDTKQAIYGFRDADYRIMRQMEEESPFPSAGLTLRELTVNRRSSTAVLDLATEVFRRTAPSLPDYREAARRSGLDQWTQAPAPGAPPGRVGVEILPRNDEEPPEKESLCRLMTELHDRGWAWGDIALLATKNDHIVRATSWLNEMRIPFISFSSLDVRSRRVAGELIALLAFLDSPPDDLAFATFLLGEVCGRKLKERDAVGPVHAFLLRCREERPLYKAFQRDFPRLWTELFAGLFRSAGYLPLYDLVSEAYAAFDVFSLVPEEEATLAKLLEAVKDFEGAGANSLREFLAEAGNDSEEWAITVPRNADSVRAMTIHKSKGLGFPVVVLLLYGDKRRTDPYTINEEDGGARLLKITKPVAEADAELRKIYDEKTIAGTVDDLNALYVALTRAREEMYVIGAKRERDGFPFDLLPGSLAPGPAAAVAPRPGSAYAVAGLRHDAHARQPGFGGGRLGREERRRGELVHRALELLGPAPGDLDAAVPAAAERAAREARADAPSAAVVSVLLGRMMRTPPLAGWFAAAPGRSVFVEQEFCDRNGRMYRMDRVVVDPDRVTVIDFKTGREETAEHIEQVRGYVEILRDVYPCRAIEGALAYVDLCALRRVE